MARAAVVNWGTTILFNVALPLATYFVLTGHGVRAVPALLASGAWPVVETALSLAVRRHVDEFAILTLVFIGLGVVAGLGFNSAHLVLVKESIVTGLFGVLCLGSLAVSRPLMFYFGRRFATDGTPEGVAYWNGLWQYPSFRRTQKVVTIVWGVVFVAEALVRVALSYALSTSAMTVVSSVMPLAVIGGLVAWTVSYGRRARAAALAAHGIAGA
ncbi:MAG TPA: VC0807 family protein [Rugosimonospora sp.]|nr:VC0807 family protein [Rugosimonospora sp.]